MAKPGLQLGPRGFLGYLGPNPLPTNIRPQTARMRSVAFSPNLFEVAPQEYFQFSMAIEELFQRSLNWRNVIADYAFRRSVVAAAKYAFGLDFLQWYRCQLAEGFVSDLHLKFLDDTMQFIMSGRRELDLMTWISLIEQAGVQDERAFSETSVSFFGKYFPGIQNSALMRTDTVDVLQEWVSQENGFQDLLLSLRVLFGNI